MWFKQRILHLFVLELWLVSYYESLAILNTILLPNLNQTESFKATPHDEYQLYEYSISTFELLRFHRHKWKQQSCDVTTVRWSLWWIKNSRLTNESLQKSFVLGICYIKNLWVILCKDNFGLYSLLISVYLCLFALFNSNLNSSNSKFYLWFII